ncbi:MAG: chitobiase/beta-hexosaminidase C-terminal domain-containing protein, partial [Kiritimatiellaeota bacterium]|nr:chitobiase/beta-hexosaminidase C-terminal domain-containing protein [Kiritimatiellota bacterium]
MKSVHYAFLFALAVFVSPLVFGAGVKARYVRVDNPSGLVFRCRQLEVYSGGKNIVLNHPEWVTGTTHPLPSNKNPDRLNTIVNTPEARACRDVVNGDTDVSGGAQEWITWHAPGAAYEWGPWFEIDLQEEVEVEKIVFYGSLWPKTFYVDKGHRTIVTMDANRVVNWGVQFQYHDKANFPDGVFAFPVEKKGKAELQVVGTKIPPRALDWVPMDWILKADKEIPPPDADVRMARFAQRNSPAEIRKVADALFMILDESTPGLESAFREYRAGNHAKALDAWKVYWFAKMRRVNQHQALNLNKAYSAAGDDLLKGLMVTIMPNEARAIKYTPGRIRWVIVPEDKDAPDFRKQLTEALADGERKASVGSVSWPLLYAYRANPDPKYIERWAEIMDDWSLNFFADAAKVPYEVENFFTFNPAHTWCQMMEDLDDIARERPSLIAAIPSATFARAQMIALEKYTTAWWRQARETVFNHNTGGFYAWEPILFYIDEFHPGKRTAKEWRECVERWLVLSNFRDGSMTEIGDEGHMEIPTLMSVIANRLDTYDPPPGWYTPGWKNHYLEWVDNMYLYMLRHLAPGGYEHRDKPDYRTYRWTSTTKPYWTGRPTVALDRDKEILELPEIRRMLGIWGFLSVPLPEPAPPTYAKDVIDGKWAPVQKAMRERWGAPLADAGKPRLTSDWMPYYGGWYFRGGWEMTDPFLHMVAMGAHGGGHPFLYPYGMCYLYDHNFPLVTADPVRIKNLPPLQVHGMEHRYNPGTKVTFLTHAEQDPMDFRWHSSENFDFGEAVHDGAYGNFPNMKGNWDDTSLEMQPLPERVTGIKTTRQIVHLRKQRLFLIIDRVEGNTDGHEISIQYKPALSTPQGAPLDPDKQLTLTPLEGQGAPKTEGTLRTDNPGGAPSLTMWQFADQPFCYRLERKAEPDFKRYACRLGGGTGIAEPTVRLLTKAPSLTLVTLLESRVGGGVGDRIASIEPRKAQEGENPIFAGFIATMTDGTRIAGSRRGAEVRVGIRENDNKTSYGFALGVTRPPQMTDYEYQIKDSKRVDTPIFRPIKPVRFEPNRTTFSGTETVTMKSDTPDVEIRYTTDGTPPGRNSTLYTGPITINKTTEIAARAYRIGNGKEPYPPVAEDFELNGTKFTVPSYAFYRQRDMAPPVLNVRKADLKPGLATEYLE